MASGLSHRRKTSFWRLFFIYFSNRSRVNSKLFISFWNANRVNGDAGKQPSDLEKVLYFFYKQNARFSLKATMYYLFKFLSVQLKRISFREIGKNAGKSCTYCSSKECVLNAEGIDRKVEGTEYRKPDPDLCLAPKKTGQRKS